MSDLLLTDSLLKIPGIGPSSYLTFEKNNVRTVLDFLRIYPRSYRNFTKKITIAELTSYREVTLSVKIISLSTTYLRSRKSIQRMTVEDKSGSLTIVWFNQPYLKNIFVPGKLFYLSGMLVQKNAKSNFRVIEYEEISKKPMHTAKIVPYYRSIYGMSSRVLRTKFDYVLKNITLSDFSEYLNKKIIASHHLPNVFNTFLHLHQAPSIELLENAQKRLTYEQIFNLSFVQFQQRLYLKTLKSAPIIYTKNQNKIDKLIQSLPYTLTKAQKTVLEEVMHDIEKPHPMSRLLLGDVGSGKTVVATILMYLTVSSGYKAILLAPTEILAQQHYATIQEILKGSDISVSLLTSSHKTSLEKTQICVATHAALYKKELPSPVGLIIIDEQHRFGVAQRDKLLELSKHDNNVPHLLTLSATPIPRSLALVMYGAISLSIIDELPKGRKPVSTKIIPEFKRNACYQWIHQEVKSQKTQVFVVVPLIEDSSDDMSELSSINQELKRLSAVFPHMSIASLHGKSKDKNKIMDAFRQGDIDILLATSVIEVGVDVPNASIMLIENPQQFGLAQLHQLRGRVGRGHRQSYCFLMGGSKDNKRLEALESHHSGFELADIDLKLRGPGNLLGDVQHGFKESLLSSNFDPEFIKLVQKDVEATVANNPNFAYNSLLVEREDIINVSLH